MGSERILDDVGVWNVDRISSSPWWDVGADEEEVDLALSASEREEE